MVCWEMCKDRDRVGMGWCVMHTHSQGVTSLNCDSTERRAGVGADWCGSIDGCVCGVDLCVCM